MSRGRRISDAVKELIFNEAIEQPNKDRTLLAHELLDKIDKMGEYKPDIETLKRAISYYRNQPLHPLDKPWSLATSSHYNFSPDSTPTLLRVRKLCLALDSQFTIRQAKWVTYLSYIISDVVRLKDWSEYYAGLERAYNLMHREEDFITSDLDSILSMSPLEYATQCFLGNTWPEINNKNLLVRPTPGVKFIEDSYAAAEQAESNALSSYEPNIDRDVISPLKKSDLSEDVIWVYTYWLTTLTNGPKWKSFDKQQAIDIINHLREWANNFQILKPVMAKTLLDLVDTDVNIQLLSTFNTDGFTPYSLLLQAGYFETPSDIPGHPDKLIKRVVRLANKRKNFKIRHPDFDINKLPSED